MVFIAKKSSQKPLTELTFQFVTEPNEARKPVNMLKNGKSIFRTVAVSLIVFIICTLLVIAFLMSKYTVLSSFNSTSDYYHQNSPPEYEPSTCEVATGEKFDCFPRGLANETSCKARGCCWFPQEEHSKVPWCYYATGFGYYKVVNKTEGPRGQKLTLELVKNSTYPRNSKKLKVSIQYESETRVHVKITDADISRFEPPYPEVPVLGIPTNKRKYKVHINENPFGFAIIREDTNTIIFDTRNIGGFIYSDQFLQLSAFIPSKYIWGLGEQRNNFLLSTDWHEITLFNHDDPPASNTNLYGTHPFYLALDDEISGLSHGVFLLNSNAMDIILQPAPAITYRTIGGIFDFYFFLGPDPQNVVAQYTEVIGRPFLPPYWSLGFHLSRFGLKTLQDTMDFWDRNKKSGIPFDTQWNDIDYMDNRNDFTISPAYQNLSTFVDVLHKNNMKYVVILDPGVASREKPDTYPPYDNGIKRDIFIKNSSNLPLEGQVWNLGGGTVFPDFTHPNVVSYWLELLRSMHEKFQYDGIWLDMNEISNFVQGSLTGCETEFQYLNDPPYLPNVVGNSLNYKTICMSAKHYVSTHYNVHNIFGFAETMVTSFCLATIRLKRPFVLSRSTFAGSGHYGAHWTGDVFSTWDDMSQSVKDIMSFNLFGIPMIGADICGFNGNTTKELCQRWSQLGAFYPFSRNHNSDDCIDQDPAAIGIVNSTKKALLFRYHLLPYLYTLFQSAYQYGDTVIRPLFFEYPKDPLTYADNTKFLWGPALLIIPVLEEGQTSVTTYFPKGIWFDAYTLDCYQSNGDYITLDAPVDFIPLYFRAGFIIPYQEPAQTTTESRQNPFGLYVAVNETNQAYGELYWDDGETYNAFDNRMYNRIVFEYTSSLMLSGLATEYQYNVPMKLDTIKIMGLQLFDTIKEVYVNSQNHSYFKFDPSKKQLIITSANISLSTPFFVRWN